MPILMNIGFDKPTSQRLNRRGVRKALRCSKPPRWGASARQPIGGVYSPDPPS